MIFILIGCVGFLLLNIFDLNKVYLWNKYLNLFFALGVALLTLSTLGILFDSYYSFTLTISLRIVLGILAVIALSLMLYSLFIALPFNNTYALIGKRNPVIDTGIYALCRHPGVLWFFFFYLFLWLASGNKMMMWATIIWTAMDIMHVYAQERWFFPKTLDGYDHYKMNVPFLIPNLGSIQKCIRSIGK